MPIRTVEVELSHNNPDCGNCFEQVTTDGDVWICRRCKLTWSMERAYGAEYLDDDDEPCGSPPPDGGFTIHRWEDRRGQHVASHRQSPCDLPEGHQPDTLGPNHHHQSVYIHCRE